MTNIETIIIGAGASGLFCGLTLGKLGKQVLILDHANKAGKKILMSGGGRCNFSNYDISAKNYLSQNPHFVKSALARFGVWDFMDFVYKYNIDFNEKEHGQLFCTQSANDILQMLLTECNNHKVDIELNTEIVNIKKDDNFILTTIHKKTGQSQTYSCQNLIIATGGLSIPTMGATGFGYEVARQFGHSIIPTSASLVPFTFTDKMGEYFKALAGVSLDVVAFNDKASFKLPMLFTHRGLSGPAILQLSNYWQIGELIFINLLPNIDVVDFLLTQKTLHPKRLIKTAIGELTLPKKVLASFEIIFWENDKDTELGNIKDSRLKTIGKQLNAWQLLPSGTEGYRTAEVTKGGVNCDEVSSKTMESLLCPDLYFVGEVLDITGQLGGYNFHWAWASGYACAMAIGGR